MSKRKSKPDSQKVKPDTRLPRRRKLLFGIVITVFAFCSLEFALWMCNVKPANVKEDPFAGFSRHIPHFVEADDGGSLVLTVSDSKSEVLNTQQFLAQKPDDVYRIVCLGGSTTYGRPFSDETSFSGWLRELLPFAEPGQNWEVINAGGISYASYRVMGVMQELAQYDPDLYVVYTGQNEFLERRTYDGWQNSPSVVGPMSLLYRTRTAGVVRDILDLLDLRSKSGEPKPELGAQTKAIPINSVGPNAYERDDELKREVVTHFRSTLQTMSSLAEQTGAEIVFVVPGSNLADFAPFKSEQLNGLSDSAAAAWKAHRDKASSLINQTRYEDALDEIERAIAIDERHAGTWYLKGKALQALSRFDDAKEAFLCARDEDICPLRAIDPLIQVVREHAEFSGASAVDFERLVEQHSENGLPGASMFHDHVHPTMKANRLLALALINELHNRGIVQSTSSLNDATINEVTQNITRRIDRQNHAAQLRSLAAMMVWLKQPEGARTQAELSLEFSGRTAQALGELAAKFEAMDARDLALEYWLQAVEVAPDSPNAHFRLGSCAADIGNAELSNNHLNEAVRLDGNMVKARVRLGVALATQGQLQQAEDHLTKAVERQPDAADIRSNLGLVVAKQGRFQDAIEHYKKSLALDNSLSSTHYNAGLAYEELGQLEKAAGHYRATINLANGHANAQMRLQAILNK